MTRPSHQQDALALPLEARGARVVRAPLIALSPPPDPEVLAGAARELVGCVEGWQPLVSPPFDWILLTSANATRALSDALSDAPDEASGGRFGPASWAALRARGVKVACVGASTARALEAAGGSADLLPERFVAEGLLESLAAREGERLRGARVLLPRAVVARDVLPEGLAALGARVTLAHTYETGPRPLSAPLRAALSAPPVGCVGRLITFTSDSTVDAFVGQWAEDPVGREGACASSQAVVIGPVVAARARAVGLAVAEVAAPHTVDGLIEACERAAHHR